MLEACICDKIKCYCDTYIGKSASHRFLYRHWCIQIGQNLRSNRPIQISSFFLPFSSCTYIYTYIYIYIQFVYVIYMHPLLDFLLKTRSICFHRYIRNKEENDKGENRWEPILSIRIHRSAVTRWTLECGDKPSVKSSWPFECSSGLICSRSVRAVPWTFYFTYSRYVMASTSFISRLNV